MGQLIQLSNAANEKASKIGGKAANLASLLAAGFPVPKGFVLPVEAYDKFISDNGLKELIARSLESADLNDDNSLSNTSKAVKELIISKPFPDELAKEVLSGLTKAGEGRLWAVRSSAEAEDLACASFAGQQDTFLCVKASDVPENIKRCWASYWNQRAMAYRKNAGIPQLSGGIAVVVEQMVNASSSGVMFTSDPLNKDRSRDMVIESSWGLGESIVSGIVTPDRFTCRRGGFKVLDKKISRKGRGIFASEAGNKTIEIESYRQEEPSLTEQELQRLVELGERIEQHFGAPQDIEWAIVDGKPFILQSRPITALQKSAEVLWTRAYGDEYWSDVTSPLFYSTMGEYLTKYVLQEGYKVMGYWELSDMELLRLYKGHIYFNAAVLEAVFTYNPRFSRTKELLNYFPIEDQERIATAKTKIAKRLWSEVRIAIKDPDGTIFRTDKAYKKWAKGFLQVMKGYDSLDLKALSNDELYEQYVKMVDAFVTHYRLIRYGMVTHSIGTNLIVKTWLNDWLGDKSGELYSGLLSGLPDNKTITTNNALIQLARSARNDPILSQALLTMPLDDLLAELGSNAELADFKSQFDGFLKEYGHRSHTRELFFPRWSDDPTLVLDILRSLVPSEDIDTEALEREKVQKRVETQREISRRISKTRLGLFKKPVFQIVLGYAQTYLQFRENQRFYLDHTLYRMRRLFMEYGRRFSEQGLIRRADDIFFLSKEEVFALAKDSKRDYSMEIQERRAEFEEWSDKLPPKFVRGKAEFDDTLEVAGDAVKVTGVSASPGIAQGTIRVVDSINGLSLVKQGEILVTSNTDPGWTPVFSKLGGLITETGGILCHGAVVSREYGIPAVTAVKGARQIFKDGQKVTIDGNEGVIYLRGRD